VKPYRYSCFLQVSRMVEKPIIVDKRDIEAVLGSNLMEALLPEWTARLTRASVPKDNLLRCDIPYGDSKSKVGLDGDVETSISTEYVPEGLSIFEFGKSGVVRTKAQKEYDRVHGITENAADKYFVFVSCRNWHSGTHEDNERQKRDWEEARANEQKYRGVSVLDLSSLIQWTRQYPEVGLWLKSQLNPNFKLTGITFSSNRVVKYMSRFNREISSDILICEQQRLKDGFDSNTLDIGSPFRVYANSANEASAAICHSINVYQKKHEDATSVEPIVISNKESVDLFTSSEGLVLILEGSATERAHELGNNKVIICKPITPDMARENKLVLRRPNTDTFALFLKLAGVENHDSEAKGCGRTLTALERRFPGGDYMPPAWSSTEHKHADDFRYSILFGAWNAEKNRERKFKFKDVDLITELIEERSYRQVASSINKVIQSDIGSGTADPLFIRIGENYHLNAPIDAFFRLAPSFTTEHFEILELAIIRVLSSKKDKKIDPNEIFDESKYLGYSGDLIGGVILSFVLVGVFGDELNLTAPTGLSCNDWCRSVFEKLPDFKKHPQLLENVSSYLPLLAEGAPNAFMTSLKSMLQGDTQGMSWLLTDVEGPYSLHASHRAHGIQWALERLAWLPDCLETVTDLLMGMHLCDPSPDSKNGNRPLATLQGIFTVWSPQTSASVDLRNACMDRIVKRFPSVAFEVLLGFIPSDQGWVTQNSQPIFTNVEDIKLTWGDIHNATDHLFNLVIGLIGDDLERASKLLEDTPRMPDELFEKFCRTTEHLLSSTDGHAIAWNELRNLIGHHTRFDDVDWAMPPARIKRLETLLDLAKPNHIEASKYLFASSYVDLHLDEDYSARRSKLDTLRDEIAKEFDLNDSERVIEYTNDIGEVGIFSTHLGITSRDPAQLMRFLNKHLSKIKNSSLFARGLSFGASQSFGATWTTMLLNNSDTLSDTVKGDMLGAIAITDESLKLIESSDVNPEITDRFWKNVNLYAFRKLDYTEETIKKLLEVNRHHELASQIIHDGIDVSDSQLVDVAQNYLDSLVREIKEKGNNAGTNFYDYFKLLDCVETRGLMSLEKLAALEFPIAKRFRFRSHKRDLALHRLILSEPSQFTHFIDVLYKPDKGSKSREAEVTKEKPSQDMVTTCWHVLNSIDRVPFQNGDEIDLPKLRNWISESLRLCAEIEKEGSGAYNIGEFLSYSKVDPDDEVWPHIAVREVLEELSNDRMLQGFTIGEFNSRGVRVGDSETYSNNSADKFEAYAKQLTAWPKVQKVVQEISDSDKSRAQYENLQNRKEAARANLR